MLFTIWSPLFFLWRYTYMQLNSDQNHNCLFTFASGQSFLGSNIVSDLTWSQKQPNRTHLTRSSWPQWLPGSLLSFTYHSVITWLLVHLPPPNHTEGLIQKLSVINYQLPLLRWGYLRGLAWLYQARGITHLASQKGRLETSVATKSWKGAIGWRKLGLVWNVCIFALGKEIRSSQEMTRMKGKKLHVLMIVFCNLKDRTSSWCGPLLPFCTWQALLGIFLGGRTKSHTLQVICSCFLKSASASVLLPGFLKC